VVAQCVLFQKLGFLSRQSSSAECSIPRMITARRHPRKIQLGRAWPAVSVKEQRLHRHCGGGSMYHMIRDPGGAPLSA